MKDRSQMYLVHKSNLSIAITFVVLAMITVIIISLILSNMNNLSKAINMSNKSNNLSNTNMSGNQNNYLNISRAVVTVSDNCSCSDIYDPVKCYINGSYKEYHNYCYAYCDNVTNCTRIFKGSNQNNSDNDNISNSSSNSYSSNKSGNRSCICITEFAPVECTKDGVTKTFSNACFARCNGFTYCQPISKVKPITTPNPESYHSCVCPAYYSPVICTKDGISRSFSNICFAHCLGFRDCTAEMK